MSLFTEDPAAPVVDMDVESTGRFRLHRAGIRNVWQYDDALFLFSDGRLLLRGKNGAGKSKAMEMLLPFLLDGDSRNIDAVTKDRTTLQWLMTEGREPGNHIGYMWLELRAVADDGTTEYRTLGCGMKTSTSTRRPTAWFFCTGKRVGVDLAVDDDTAGMLAQDAFRAQLDPEEYFTTAPAYAARVAKDIFGIEDLGRYRNLCHLLYQLRRPSVGENIEAGEHTKVLSEALPELDDELIKSVASSFDDLTQIRDDLTNAERTEKAVAEFLTSYRDYTRTVLRARAGTAKDDADSADSARRALTKAEQAAEAALTELDDATGALDDLDATERNARSELEMLRALPAYTQAQHINDRRRRVEAHRGQAETAEQAAEQARGHERDAAQRATSAAAGIDSETARLNSVRLGALLEAAHLDAGLAPAELVVTDTTPAAEQSARFRRSGASGPVTRYTPRQVDTAALGTDLDATAARSEQLRSNTDSRRRNAEALLADARRVEQLDTTATRLETTATDADTQVSQAVDDEARARRNAARAEAEWRAQLGEWRSHPGAARVGGGWPDLSPYLTAPDGPDADLLGPADIDDAEALMDAAFTPAEAEGRTAHGEAIADHRQAKEQLQALQAERDRVAARPDRLPQPTAYISSDRDLAAGAPLYTLVDFAEGLDPAAEAGVEAALQASGLLDAWVAADGTTDVDHHDLAVSPQPLPAGTVTLASVLTVALPPDCPVPAARVEALLASVSLGDLGASSWMTAEGRFGLGVLTGRWAKPTAEYVGVGARRAARERELAALSEQIDEATTKLTATAGRLEAAATVVEELRAARRAWPPARALLEARTTWGTRQTVTASARRRHRELVGAAQTARDEHIQAERQLRHDAATAGIPHTAAELRRLIDTLKDLKRAIAGIDEAVGRVRAVADAHDQACASWAKTSEARQETEDAARAKLDSWQEEASALATLEDTQGEPARKVMARVADTETELAAALEALPEARRKQTQAVTREATAASEAKQARKLLDAQEAQARLSAETLARVLNTPGLHLAAFGPNVTAFSFTATQPGAALVRAVRSFAADVAAAAAGGSDVSDSVILRRYEQLGPGLAGGYDAAADETDDGVKVFEVHDDTGHHPIAIIAGRLAAEVADAKRRLTRRQEEVFERYLLGELGDHLRRQLNDADTLVRAMNQALAPVRTSHGLGVRLSWQAAEDAPAEAVEAIPLLRDAPAIRGPERTARLGELLGSLIEATRLADPTASYEAHLRNALDYRNWHSFTIKVLEDAKPGADRRLTKKLKVSQGEQRVLAYLSLFSGAAAYFDSLKRKAPRALRVILLDDAFATIDEPTHPRLLNLLRDLDLDFVMTSERVTGFVPGLSLEIYECLRDPQLRGVATVHSHWDGQRAQLQLV